MIHLSLYITIHNPSLSGSATILCLDPDSIHLLLRIAGLGVGVFLLLALRISVPKVDSWDVVLVVKQKPKFFFFFFFFFLRIRCIYLLFFSSVLFLFPIQIFWNNACFL